VAHLQDSKLRSTEFEARQPQETRGAQGFHRMDTSMAQ
jgi:hypothetical protein